MSAACFAEEIAERFGGRIESAIIGWSPSKNYIPTIAKLIGKEFAWLKVREVLDVPDGHHLPPFRADTRSHHLYVEMVGGDWCITAVPRAPGYRP